jgi:hypothetical protein
LEKGVYFSVADRQLEPFLDAHAFERSLVLDVLFQPGILIPDIFCYISRGLERHVLKSGRQSLFEACLAKNLVIPAFRARVRSFQEALAVIRGEGDPARAIQGVLGSANAVADRLQFAADVNPDFSPAYWPEHDIGGKFEQVVERYLSRAEPPEIESGSGIDQEELKKLWKMTEAWRIDCIHEARDRTREIASVGLRRGEIMNAVGRQLGLPEDHMVDDICELLGLAKSAKESQALQFFWRWVGECYHYNHAKEFGAILSFPSYDPLGGLIANSVLPVGMPLSITPPVPTLREIVKIPPLSILLKISPSEIIQVRQDLGPGYLTAVKTWCREPSEANASAVRTSQLLSKLMSRAD